MTYKYRFSIEANIPINKREELLMNAFSNTSIVGLLEVLRLPVIDNPSIIRDVIYESDGEITPDLLPFIRDSIAKESPGFIKHTGWDSISES